MPYETEPSEPSESSEPSVRFRGHHLCQGCLGIVGQCRPQPLRRDQWHLRRRNVIEELRSPELQQTWVHRSIPSACGCVFFVVNSGNAPNFEHVHFGTCRIYPYLTLVEFETCLEPGETTIKGYLQVQIMEDGLGEDPLLAACAALPSPANDLQMAGSS